MGLEQWPLCATSDPPNIWQWLNKPACVDSRFILRESLHIWEKHCSKEEREEVNVLQKHITKVTEAVCGYVWMCVKGTSSLQHMHAALNKPAASPTEETRFNGGVEDSQSLYIRSHKKALWN